MKTQAIVGSKTWPFLLHYINSFFFKPCSARPLAVLRIGLSVLLLGQAFVMSKSFLLFFAPMGLVQREVSSTLSDPSVPGFNWLIDQLSRIGMGSHLSLTALGFLYAISLCFLLFGSFTRLSAFFAWLLHWSFVNTGYSGAYGADMYAHFFLFYLIWVPCGEAYSLDNFCRKGFKDSSYQARLGLRVLQLHMCISYLASGLEKASGAQWWNGEALWIALNTPNYSIGDFHWLAQVPFLPMVGGWIVMSIEIFYCVMVWPKKIRPFAVGVTCLIHVAIAIFLNLQIFGILMCIPTLALFAVSAEPTPAKAYT